MQRRHKKMVPASVPNHSSTSQTHYQHQRSARTRKLILAATDKVIREHGVVRATTKLIAKTAGIAEATIFKYFEHKSDLMFEASRIEGVPLAGIAGPEAAGTDTICAHLSNFGQAALTYYRRIVPSLIVSLADAALLSKQRRLIVDRKSSSQDIYDRTVHYLAEEQRLGRIRPYYAPTTVADMLLGPCFRRVFRQCFMGTDSLSDTDEQFLSSLIQTLSDAITIQTTSKLKS